ncbi:MAG: DUF4365 domain-containing protein, partial [Planctomycetota bacterium]|nr:DUF4365 domain-containing protein [Planctomycetota bacterium]
MEEIYATLVVRLSYSEEFKKDQLWKDAADFKTRGGKRVGLVMKRKVEGTAEILVYFEAGVSDDAKVTFIKYVHEHLLAKAADVTRVRTYVCPACQKPVGDLETVRARVEGGKTDIGCGRCDERVRLRDLIEEKFGSDEFKKRVRELEEKSKINLDNESLGLLLVGDAIKIAAEAGQIYRPVVWADWGIDGEIEFRDEKGRARGKRVYLQLKSGDSYLRKRERDEKEIFAIKNGRWAEYWVEQAYPVMLVIRTSDGRIRWMNVTEYLKENKGVKQIEFEGEEMTAESVGRMRGRMMKDE